VGVYVVPGSLELGDLEQKTGTRLVDDSESTTVAGAVLELFGRLPAVGERVEHHGVQIEVLEADRRRIRRLRIRVASPRRMTG